MFNADHAKNSRKKLPKAVVMMVEKGNLVMAIKTLATDEGISMEEAKTRIDDYEIEIKAQQQQNLNRIASRQGIPNEAISFDQARQEPPDEISRVRVKDSAQSDFAPLKKGLDRQLHDMDYKKPLLPYWLKRVLIIALIMAGLFWILWRTFGPVVE